MYARMRGKDVSMKLLRKNDSPKLPNWQIQAVLSNPKHRIKKELTAVEVEQNTAFIQICVEMDDEDNDE